MRFWLIQLFILSSSWLHGLTLDVRLFSRDNVTSSWISVQKSTYYLVALDASANVIDTVADIIPDKSLGTLNVQNGKGNVSVKYGQQDFGAFTALALVRAAATGAFIIKGSGRERIYTGDLIFKSKNGTLLIINRVSLEEYVAGVVESEGGHVAEFEYFKAQAVLARTWVLRNLDKHLDEGYNVKDDVTSQAYYSKAYLQNSALILKAVRETADTILLDEKGEVVFGAFHANSGGETVNSEDVWAGKIAYLRATKDTFSLKMEKAYWQKEIDKEKFIAFYAKEMGFSASDSAFRRAVCTFKQPNRLAYFTYGKKQLKLRWVREHFGLRSTYFSVTDNGGTVLLNGRGFGHGVGLSQEGAMRMAELGFDYKAILAHYFTNVHFGVTGDINLQNKKS